MAYKTSNKQTVERFSNAIFANQRKLYSADIVATLPYLNFALYCKVLYDCDPYSNSHTN